MICVIQRVKRAEVSVNGEIVGKCEGDAEGKAGCLLVMVGISAGDREETVQRMAEKTAAMRIFEDDSGKLNLSVRDIGGSILAISNFTLCASCRRGTRPDFTGAEKPERAMALYDRYVALLQDAGVSTEKGIFGADMSIDCLLDGPVTIVLDSEKDLPVLPRS